MDSVKERLHALLANPIPIKVDFRKSVIVVANEISKGFHSHIRNLISAQI
jgi:hypothetical protein